MKVRGYKDDIIQLHKAMTQEGNIWMGRGADADLEFEDDDFATLTGTCKWSIQSALIDNAVSMRNHPERWHFGDMDPSSLEFITLYQACYRWNLVMEVYSEECGNQFQEHYICDKGVILCDDCVDWEEYWIDDYETKEEAEAELGITITDEEWENRDDRITRGGFENWDFEI